MSAPVERDNTGFVDHLVDNRYVARALQNLVPRAVTRRENPAWDAARDAALPGREVHPVVLDMSQPVVSFLLGHGMIGTRPLGGSTTRDLPLLSFLSNESLMKPGPVPRPVPSGSPAYNPGPFPVSHLDERRAAWCTS